MANISGDKLESLSIFGMSRACFVAFFLLAVDAALVVFFATLTFGPESDTAAFRLLFCFGCGGDGGWSNSGSVSIGAVASVLASLELLLTDILLATQSEVVM